MTTARPTYRAPKTTGADLGPALPAGSFCAGMPIHFGPEGVVRRTEILFDAVNPLLADVLLRFGDLDHSAWIVATPFATSADEHDAAAFMLRCCAQATVVGMGAQGAITLTGVASDQLMVRYVEGQPPVVGEWVELSSGPAQITAHVTPFATGKSVEETVDQATDSNGEALGFESDPTAQRETERDSHPDADPVAVVQRIARALGVTQHDVIRASGIAERTFYDWKTRPRRRRLASHARLWMLDQVVSDLQELLPSPAAWLRATPHLRTLLQNGRFDDLAAAALDAAAQAGGSSDSAAARRLAGAASVGEEAVLDVDVERRSPRRSPVTRRKPGRPKGGG